MTAKELSRLAAFDWLNEVVFRSLTKSTNDLALHEPLPVAAGWAWLFVAERQTAGRGRRGNRWWAGPGALTFSLAIDSRKAGIAAERWPLVPLAAGLAVRDEIAAVLSDADVSVKWPNDVYLNGRKVAGILVEQRPDSPETLVVGIGVNVNGSMSEAPADFAESAVAMGSIGGQAYSLTELLVGILSRFSRLLRVVEEEPERLVSRLNQVSYLVGRRVRLDVGEEVIWGESRGIADNGGLRLATASGLKTFLGGSIGAVE